MARRPTAETKTPERDGPRSALGDVPSENHGMLVVPESKTARVMAGGVPGARGGGSCAATGQAARLATKTAAAQVRLHLDAYDIC